MNEVASELDRIACTSGMDRDRIVVAYQQFRDRNGGDSRAAVRATEWIVGQHDGDPLRVALELHRQARRPVDGHQLRITLPSFDASRADDGGETFEVRRWAGLGTDTPVLIDHDPHGRQVADVIGWQHRSNHDTHVWVQLHPDQHQLRIRALWGELAASPRFTSTGDEWDRRHRHAVVAAAHITELSLVPADENRLPGCGVTCEPCPAHARQDPAPGSGNYCYRDRNGQLMHVRTFDTRLTVT